MRRLFLLFLFLCSPAGAVDLVSDLPACTASDMWEVWLGFESSDTDCTDDLTNAGSTLSKCCCLNGSVYSCKGTTGGGGNSFETINASSGTDPVADSSSDTLNVTAGSNVTVTGDSSTDTITIAATAPPITLDLGDDGGNDSTALAEIATENDDYLALEEESADKAMLDFRQIPPYDNYDPLRPPAAANCATCDEFYDNAATLTFTCNGGTITQSIVRDDYRMVKAMNGSSIDVAACTVAAPSGSYTVTTRVSAELPRSAAHCGLGVIRTGTQSTPTALSVCALYNPGASQDAYHYTATSYTSAQSAVGTLRVFSLASFTHPWWHQLRYDAAADTIGCYISSDGKLWLANGTASTTSFAVVNETGVTADPPYAGFFMDDQAGSTTSDMACEYDFLRIRTDANRNDASD